MRCSRCALALSRSPSDLGALLSRSWIASGIMCKQKSKHTTMATKMTATRHGARAREKLHIPKEIIMAVASTQLVQIYAKAESRVQLPQKVCRIMLWAATAAAVVVHCRIWFALCRSFFSRFFASFVWCWLVVVVHCVCIFSSFMGAISFQWCLSSHDTPWSVVCVCVVGRVFFFFSFYSPLHFFVASLLPFPVVANLLPCLFMHSLCGCIAYIPRFARTIIVCI